MKDHIRNNNGKSTFATHLTHDIIKEMILLASLCPTFFKLDAHGRGRKKKRLYRFLKFEEPIGKHGHNNKECFWLVVIAKSNSWIVSAYPIPGVFSGAQDFNLMEIDLYGA